MRAWEGIRRMFKPPDWEWSQFSEVGWWCRDGWGEILLGLGGLRLDDWREQGRVTTIKSGPHRVVYRVDLPQGTIYVKHFLVPDWRATLRQWVRRGKGRNEGKSTQHLASIGVPTITPVALGSGGSGSSSLRIISSPSPFLRRFRSTSSSSGTCRSGPSRCDRRSGTSWPKRWPS